MQKRLVFMRVYRLYKLCKIPKEQGDWPQTIVKNSILLFKNSTNFGKTEKPRILLKDTITSYKKQ